MTEAREIDVRRAKLSLDLSVLEDGVSEALSHARASTIEIHAKIAEILSRVDSIEGEFRELVQRLRQLRVSLEPPDVREGSS